MDKKAEQSRYEETKEERLGFDDVRELIASARALAGPNMGEEIELRRKDAYVELPTQKLLRSLLEKGKNAEILPTYDPSYGFRYKAVESVFDEEAAPAKSAELLERLHRLKILQRSFADTVSACPGCGSTSITLHYRCPRCSSHHIVKTGLTEHIPCGNIDERERYSQGRGTPICPKCGAELVKGQYRDMGLWYICRECGEKFEHPELDLICHRCDSHFTIEKSVVKEIPKYAINPDMEQEIRQNVASLESIYRILTDLGFSFETSPSAIGEKSGIEHSFSLLARKDLGGSVKVAAVDHAVGNPEVSAAPLILFVYKTSEVKVDLPIFVAIPKLSETARRIAQGYNMIVVEDIPKKNEQLTMLHDKIEKAMGEEAIREPMTLQPQLLHEWLVRKGTKVEIWRDQKGRFVAEEKAKELVSPSESSEEPKKPSFVERIRKSIKGE